jgi:hypothetical protein
MNHLLLVHSSPDRHLLSSNFWLLWMMPTLFTITWCTNTSLSPCFQFFGYIKKRKLHLAAILFNFWRIYHTVFHRSHTIFYSLGLKGSNFSISSLMLVIFWIYPTLNSLSVPENSVMFKNVASGIKVPRFKSRSVPHSFEL